MVIKDPSETCDQGSTNIDNIRTPDNLQLFGPFNISTCIAWQFFFPCLQRQIKKTLQDKTVVELFVQFLVHLLLSTIGGGKRTICQGGKEADIKDCVHTPSPEDSHHHKHFPRETSYICARFDGTYCQAFPLPFVKTQLMEQLNCLTFGYLFVELVVGTPLGLLSFLRNSNSATQKNWSNCFIFDAGALFCKIQRVPMPIPCGVNIQN